MELRYWLVHGNVKEQENNWLVKYKAFLDTVSSYKLIDVLSGRRGSTDTVVSVATVEFRSGTVVLNEKLMFNVAYGKYGLAESHFGTNSRAIDLFIITVRE